MAMWLFQVFDRLQRHYESSQKDDGSFAPIKWWFLGVQVCFHTWKRLHSVGILAGPSISFQASSLLLNFLSPF